MKEGLIIKDLFSGAIFEGLLASAQPPKGRGSAFGTLSDDYFPPYIPVYDPLCEANIMKIDLEEDYRTQNENPPAPHSKQDCSEDNSLCQDCGACEPR